ncbi:MAG: glycosyltransferase family 2 protein [Planctomycetota bacterium]
MSDQPLVSVIIPAYKARDYLRKCLQSIEENLSVPHEVIVVEDAGRDGTVDMVRLEFPHVVLLENEQNLGVIGARARGIEKARASLLFFVDSDIELLPGVFEALHGELKSDARIAYVTCNKRSVDGTHQRSAFAWPTLSGQIRAMIPPIRTRDVLSAEAGHRQAFDPGWISVGHSLMRLEAFKETGGFLKGVFFFGEDVDICAKLRAKGWRVRFIPYLGFVHHGSISQVLEPNRFRVKSWLSSVILADLYWPRWQALVLRFLLFFRGLVVCGMQICRGQDVREILQALPKLLWPIPLTTNYRARDALG